MLSNVNDAMSHASPPLIHVLAVDDEPDLCALTKEFLEMNGEMSVDTTSSVKEARNALTKRRYDAIVSDYQMPGEDGIQFLKSLGTADERTPFILFTGKGREEVVIDALNNGADSYLQKGGEPKSKYAELGHRIKLLVHRHQADEAQQEDAIRYRTEAERMLKETCLIPPVLVGKDPDELIHELQVHQIELRMQAEELRRAHLSMEESRDRYIDLFEFAPLGYLTLTDNGFVTEANLTGATLLNLVRNKLERAPFSKFVAEKDSDQWYRYFKDVLGQKEQRTCTLTLRRGDGSQFPARLQAIRTPDLGEGRMAVRVAFSDISDIRQLEEVMRESEARYRIILDQAADAVFMNDQNGRIIEVNQKACHSLGYSREELLSRPIRDIDPDLFQTGTYRRLWDRIIAGGAFTLESRHRCKDGSTIPVEETLGPVRLPNGLAILGIFRDITERNRTREELEDSEDFYHNLFQDSRAVILLIDPVTGGIVDASRAATDYYGYEKERIINMRISDILTLPPDELKVQMELAVLGEKKHFLFQHKLASGEVRDVEVLSGPFNVKGRKVLYSIVQDITERKRAEDALHEANRKLNLLSSITRHDINNQTTVLEGHLALLKIGQPDLSSDEHLMKAEIAAKRISEMIRFTKEYEDIGVRAPTWENVRGTVENCVNKVHLGPIHLVNDVPSDAELFADPLVVKVFYNLMDNAVRYGGKITTIRLSIEERNGVHVIVCEDDGVGISASKKERLFTKSIGNDHGFGLFLSREILAITGITITENGEPSKGARFEITVPKGFYQINNMDGKELANDGA